MSDPEPKAAGNRGKGRVKGVPNKTTAIAKDVIAFTADGLGGGPGLLAWAKKDAKNEHAFWTIIYPKLLPLQVDANHRGFIGIGSALDALPDQ